MQDLSGQKLGPYEIIGEIGHGGMANVYRARQTSIGRDVAIKVLPPYFLQDRTFLERFNREVQVIARLQHPRILPVIDYGEHENTPYIVMAYMPGGTLADRIREAHGLPLDDAARLMAQIAEGLDYAHEKGVIHRDFKPSNVLLDEKGNAHLADFGIAKITADTAQLTGSGMVGTPSYMAPEMSRAGGVTPLVDVYAMGVTLFQMLTGRQPFAADTPIGVMMAHATEPIPDVRQDRPDLPAAVQAIVEKAMAKDPAQRYQTPGALAADLSRAAAGEMPVASAAPVPTVTQTAPAAREDTQGMTMPVAPTPTPTAAPAGTEPVKRRGLPRGLVIIGGVVVVMLCIVFFIFGALRNRNKNAGTVTPGSGAATAGQATAAGGEGSAKSVAPPHNGATAAALSGLPGMIYFSSDLDGDFEIYSVRPDGTALTQLTFNTSTDNGPDVTIDGGRILFITDREEASSDQLYVMARDGSGQTRIREGQETYGETPRWSPDGTKVAFSAYDNTFDLIVVQLLDLDGGAASVLTGAGRDEQWNPDFSPDGTQVVYSLQIGDNDAQIFVVNLDGTNPVQITQSGGNRYPDWSPDGAHILYVSDDGGIYVMRSDGSDQRMLAEGDWAGWSPDGTHIVYTSYATGEDQLYVMAADGTGQTQIAQRAAKDTQPVWGK